MKYTFLSFSLLLFNFLYSQQEYFTVSKAADTSKPFIFYITGDGGWNSFSSSLKVLINKKDFTIGGLNAKSYFWDKKTPDQTASDIAAFVNKQLDGRRYQRWVFVGYSFGAEVTPFIINRLPDQLKKKLISVVLLSPSPTTDFEIHWTDIFGMKKKRDMDVKDEINNMGPLKTVIIVADNDRDFPVQEIKLNYFKTETLPGGHHYEGNTEKVANTMIKYFK